MQEVNQIPVMVLTFGGGQGPRLKGGRRAERLAERAQR